jgi:Carboxypeptidase regulatory-like domain/TonB dependent receptor
MLACGGSLILAQSQASLVGTVRDPSGAAIPGAMVTATQLEMGISYENTTNSAGEFIFEYLPVGSVNLLFRAPSFRDLRVEGIGIHVAGTVRQDATLELAPVGALVSVESSTPLVATETAEISQLVDAGQIIELPLNGRDVFDLLQLSAGAETGVSPAARFTDSERPALAGGRAGYTVFRVEGTDINSQNLPSASIVPGVDAVSEFRATTLLAPASESSTSSVNVALKSGTNQFHGTAFDFFRNNVLDAHSFFDRNIVTPAFRTEPDTLHYNQFGGTSGGPLKKDRTFFFVSVEFARDHTLSQVTGIYPTAQMLQGNFSGVNPLSGSAMRDFGPVFDPSNGQPFPGNQVPVSRWSAFATRFLPLAFLPANCLSCQTEGLGFNFVGREPGIATENQFIGKIDHRLGSVDTLVGTLQVAPGTATTTPSPNPISVMDTPTRAYFASLEEIHIFGPSLVSESRLGYTRLGATLEQQNNAGGAFQFQNTPTSIPSLYPTIDLVGYSTDFGNGAISDRNFSLEDSWDGSEQISYSRSTHEFKAGFELVRAHFWNTVNLNAFFVYEDSLPASLGFTGVSFADFLIGVPFLGVTFQGTGKADMVERSVYAGYVQDNWKISRSLTINAGLRYEFPQQWHDSNTSLNRLGTLDVSAASQAVGGRFLLGSSADTYVPGVGVVAGSGPPLIRGSLVDPSWRDFQPRIGLAYRPFPDNKTAVRAGFGVYYALQDANSLAFEMLSPPFSYQSEFVNLPPLVPLGQPLHDSQFWPALPPAGVAQEGDDPRNRDPRLYEWTISIQHQLANNILISAEYVGNRGADNPFTVLVNTPPLPDAQQLALLLANPALDVSLATARAPFPNVGLGYQYVENVAPSWYDALNLKTDGQFGSRLHFSTVYTWSKALDLASAEQQPPAIISDPALGKSYSDYDHPQRFVTSWVYEVPSPGWFRNTVWTTLTGGWEISGIGTFESGAPYSVMMGVDTSFTGGSAPSFPDLEGPPVTLNIRQSNGIYLTPQNFVAPPFGQYGTLARNAFHGPGINNFDLGLIKNIGIRERLRAQIRGELFNAFNHAQFAFAGSSLATSIAAPPAGSSMPVIQYTDPSEFGRASARPARIAQFALKLIW